MDASYRIEDTRADHFSGADCLPRIAGSQSGLDDSRLPGTPERLRPHCKTHKMPQVTKIELAHGITKHKCATFAEAEMLAEAGVPDIFLSYNLVGPNIGRAVGFGRDSRSVSFQVQADHPGPIAELGRAMSAAGQTVDVLLDLDVGPAPYGHRRGPPGEGAVPDDRQDARDCMLAGFTFTTGISTRNRAMNGRLPSMRNGKK